MSRKTILQKFILDKNANIATISNPKGSRGEGAEGGIPRQNDIAGKWKYTLNYFSSFLMILASSPVRASREKREWLM